MSQSESSNKKRAAESPDTTAKKRSKNATSNGSILPKETIRDPSLPNNKSLPDSLNFPPPTPETIKIASWNVASLNAALKKGFWKYVDAEDPDILCLQETKVNMPMRQAFYERYRHQWWAIEQKKGYSGTAVFSKHKPLSSTIGIPNIESSRGRVITLEFNTLYLVACYVPNAGEGLKNLEARKKWDNQLLAYVRELEEKKPVVWCGDLNVAHSPLDIARPQQNRNKSAGFSDEEREGFCRFLSVPFDPAGPMPSKTLPEKDASPPIPESQLMVDTYRHLHPQASGHYTYFSYRFRCREKGVGWRLDYFVVSKSILDRVVASEIRHDCYGASDHIPIILVLKGDI
ncbi:uncharacterized protein VTP21DRAFT_3265 [Calcarisporiella thermophila]|uniref:uncharacterized protein n=1 Tax=Calcarisporiella thermophila TaxID=911321 RepID=UPI0037442001